MRSFPINLENRPAGFAPLTEEPPFVAARHLALEAPAAVLRLAELGYSADESADCPSDFGVSGVFRVLSDEGAACLYEVAKQLEAYATRNPRIDRTTRGGVYRSAFLRDLCLCPEVTDFVSEIAGLPLMPHTIPHQLGHLNYNPPEVGKNVDKWHVDTLRFDYVMFVTDPNRVAGGAFQYFKGSKHEMEAMRRAGDSIPADRIVSPALPGAGYAIMQQGNMVVHQAKGLTAPGERITMVNGYMPLDPSLPDYLRYDQLLFADPEHVVTAEYSRHVALLCQRLLAEQAAATDFTTDRRAYADRLSAVAQRLEEAAQSIRNADSAAMEHFGD